MKIKYIYMASGFLIAVVLYGFIVVMNSGPKTRADIIEGHVWECMSNSPYSLRNEALAKTCWNIALQLEKME